MKRAYNFQDLTGQRFGKLTVVRFDGRRNDSTWFWCLCDCGVEKSIRAASLKKGATKSCGCYHDDYRAYIHHTHGMTGTPEHNIWCGIRQRCLDQRSQAYSKYGGRGIDVCDRWIESFENFYADMGARPGPEFTMERIDNDGPYSPENCRWADRIDQANNRSNGVTLTHQGRTQTLAQWSKESGIKYGTLWFRAVIQKMPPEKALETRDRRRS